MSLLVIEIVLWIGFALVIWAMRDSLLHVESELQTRVTPKAGVPPRRRAAIASRPQRQSLPIGHYRGRIIHDFVVIDGRHYRFAHVCPHPGTQPLAGNERWVAPGLIYVESPPPDTGRSTA